MNGIYQTLCILSNRTLTLWKRCRKIPMKACSLFIPPFSSLSEASAMSTNCQHTMHCTLPTANACTTQVPQVVHLDLVSLSLCNPTIKFGDKRCISAAGNRIESLFTSLYCSNAIRPVSMYSGHCIRANCRHSTAQQVEPRNLFKSNIANFAVLGSLICIHFLRAALNQIAY